MERYSEKGKRSSSAVGRLFWTESETQSTRMGRQTQTSFLPLHPVFAFQNAGWRNVNPDSVTFGGVCVCFFFLRPSCFKFLNLEDKCVFPLSIIKDILSIRGNE